MVSLLMLLLLLVLVVVGSGCCCNESGNYVDSIDFVIAVAVAVIYRC